MNRTIVTLSFLLLFGTLTTVAQRQLKYVSEQQSRNFEAEQEVLYLPNGNALEAISFGYRNLLSDLLWFKAISYFGKHLQTDRDYGWLGHMCDLVTDLNPRAKHVYDFCALMLAWEAEKPAEANRVLTKALTEFPADWNILYYRGFNNMYFLHDSKAAKRDFQSAAKIPGAPAFLARLAAKKMDTSDPVEAVRFLREMVRHATDESERAVLMNKLQNSQHLVNLSNFEKAISIYFSQTGKQLTSLQDLISSGIVTPSENGFRDPWGGKYYWDKDKQQIRSTRAPSTSQ